MPTNQILIYSFYTKYCYFSNRTVYEFYVMFYGNIAKIYFVWPTLPMISHLTPLVTFKKFRDQLQKSRREMSCLCARTNLVTWVEITLYKVLLQNSLFIRVRIYSNNKLNWTSENDTKIFFLWVFIRTKILIDMMLIVLTSLFSSSTYL